MKLWCALKFMTHLTLHFEPFLLGHSFAATLRLLTLQTTYCLPQSDEQIVVEYSDHIPALHNMNLF